MFLIFFSMSEKQKSTSQPKPAVFRSSYPDLPTNDWVSSIWAVAWSPNELRAVATKTHQNLTLRAMIVTNLATVNTFLAKKLTNWSYNALPGNSCPLAYHQAQKTTNSRGNNGVCLAINEAIVGFSSDLNIRKIKVEVGGRFQIGS